MSLRGREPSLLNILLEVVLISIGVFLALWANNWHEDRQHRALAESTLRNFADEMRANQQAVQKYRQYHETLARELHEFLATDEPPTQERFDKSVHFQGVRPIIFEHTAWDLALATQALSYFKPQLAFDIAKVYTEQTAFQTLENSFLASAFTPATFSTDDLKGLTTAMEYYLVDINQKEPAILQLYGQVLPEVDQAIPRSNSR
jgi:hypothetical protein